MRNIEDTIKRLPSPHIAAIPAPKYSSPNPVISPERLGLAVESMKRHMTNEGIEIFSGLESAGYKLVGHNLPIPLTDLRDILKSSIPQTLVLQDKREWDVPTGNFRDPKAEFHNVSLLKERSDIFKLTILKDSHQKPNYHKHSAEEIDCHAWIVYYHPKIVHHLAPYTRPQHLIRTYHSVNVADIPPLNWRPHTRAYCLLSGAMSSVYPLRVNISRNLRAASHISTGHIINYVSHPGYHRNGSATPGFLKTLANYKVSICTSSIYGYALRKIIESTACGCIVLTDLPTDEVLPYIDGNLIRVSPNVSMESISKTIKQAVDCWDPDRQRCYSQLAQGYYSHLDVGRRLAQDIETLRTRYNDQ